MTRLFADAGWILTSADFRQEPVNLLAIDATGVRVGPVTAGGPEARVTPFDQFLQLDRATSRREPGGGFVLYLLDGDRVSGEPAALVDEQLVFRSATLGELRFGLKAIRGMARSGKPADLLEGSRSDDFVQLSNGDSAKGIITDVTLTKLKISAPAGDLELPLASIDWFHLASAGKPAERAGRAFRIRLLDGTAASFDAVESDGTSLSFTVGGAKRQVALASLSGIEQLNGPVSWLSSRLPAQVIQIPFFGSTPWPTRMDQTVGGRPIQFGGRTYPRGIGVHAHSRLDYALDGTWEAFRTQYAIATEDKRQFANVTVRIKVDGKVIHERKNFKAEELAEVVWADLPKDAKMLTLEVDYGAANDVQDRFNWIEPALLRKKPAGR